MKRKRNGCRGGCRRRFSLLGKLLLLFLSVGFTDNLWAKAYAQSEVVTLAVRDMRMEEVLTLAERQLGKNFFFNRQQVDVSRKVDVNLSEASVEELVEVLFGVDFTFRMDGDLIVVSREGKLAMPQVKTVKVNGVVKDVKGMVLPGVTVLLKGTTVGVVTDEDGKFQLEVPQREGMAFVFSFVGMKTKEVAYKGEQVLKVVLEEEVSEMEEVVVTGYFTKSKSTYTGSAVTVQAEDLKKINPINLFKALQAYEPSLQIVENNEAGSDPNAVPEILIRGKSSFEGRSNNPLFIMDGYEVDMQKVFDFDIERIKQITILKDASATAIYGSRASNGVIVIETKMPERGRLTASYAFNATVEIPDLTDYDLLDAEEKLEFERLAGVYVSREGSVAEQMKLDKLYEARHKEVMKGVNTDWLSKPLRTAFRHNHSLYIGGGNENSRYGINANYGTNPGVMKGSKRDRFGISFTWNYTISSKLRLGNMLSVDQNTSEESPYGDFSQYTVINPYERAYDDMGRCIQRLSNGKPNPLFEATLNNINKSKSTAFNDNLDIEWYIVEGIRLTARLAYTYGVTHSDVFVSPKSSQFDENTQDGDRGTYDYSSNTNHSLDGNIVINAWKAIGKHTLTLVVGANMQDNKDDSKSFSASGFLSDKLTNLDFALQYQEGGKPRGNVSHDRLVGFFVNGSYAYDNRYFLDVSYRTDGSSKFGKKNRFAPFWSAGIGWNIHNEPFWNDPSWLTMAKIRSSIGYTGNVTFSPYQAQTTYQYTSDNIYVNGVGADIIALGNDNLKWQRKLTFNLGCDLDFWEGRFSLTGEYFREYTKDVLMDISLPPSLGFVDYKENFGEMENVGWSLNFRTQLIRNTAKELYWSVAFGTSDSNNKIKKITDKLGAMNDENNKNETKKPVPLYEEGESLDALKAVPSLGIDPETGKEVFRKKDGTLTTIWDYNDKIVCGSNDPKFRGSVNSFLTFKGISLNLSCNFQTGGQTYNQTLASRVEGVDPHSNCDRRVLYERWKKPGDRTFFKNIALEENVSNLTTRFIQDYNFFSIGNISLGYEMKRNVCRKIGLTGLRFNFNMSDVARFSSVKEERGLAYPFARQFTFSLSASL